MKEQQTFQPSKRQLLRNHLEQLRNLLRHCAQPAPLGQPPEVSFAPLGDSPDPFNHLVQAFKLSIFEQVLLLLAVGAEIAPDLPLLYSQIMEVDGQMSASIDLAQRVTAHLRKKDQGDKEDIVGDADDFFLLESPLYRWELVTIDPNHLMYQSPVKCTPWTLQYLLGASYTDPLFSGSLKPQQIDLNFSFIPESYQKLADTLLATWSEFEALPDTQLIGKDTHAQLIVASVIFSKRYYRPYLIRGHSLPMEALLSTAWMTRWQRQALLEGLALVIDCGDPTTLPEPAQQLIAELLQTNPVPVMLIGSERFPNSANVFTYDIPALTPDDQKALWNHYIGDKYAPRLNGQVGALVSQFNLSAEAIQTIATQAISQFETQSKNQGVVEVDQAVSLLWKLCRIQSRSSLEGLVERIEPKTTWDDLILPPDSSQILQQIIAMIEQRAKVYDEWRMGGNTRRGMGITSLFYGPSGTGKTTAAEIIAHDLKLDLYRVDLSQVSSKYIGETEKNLSKVFDAAESSGAVLLFDEADSIIGKRSEVKDARDRYANQEVGYLLQRMEQYSGLAILTTNLPNSLDSAFMRRIRFSVRFAYPTPEQRAQIWQKCFPPTVPTENLSYPRLAQLDASGASIRNIAMGSAFIAAKAGEPIQMKHILQAAQAELQKLGRSLTDQEVRGWV